MSVEPNANGGVPVQADPVGADLGAPAQTPASPQKGMFGITGSGDVSGFGGLVRRRPELAGTPKPYGGYFDEVTDALEEAYPGFADAIEKVMAAPLGPTGRKMLEARKAEGKVPIVAPGAMPSSYRADKVRSAEWTQAVKEGREEQLRIENWMKLQPHMREDHK